MIWIDGRQTSIIRSVNAIRQMQTLPQRPKKESWTDGEKFKMVFAREMRIEGDLKK